MKFNRAVNIGLPVLIGVDRRFLEQLRILVPCPILIIRIIERFRKPVVNAVLFGKIHVIPQAVNDAAQRQVVNFAVIRQIVEYVEHGNIGGLLCCYFGQHKLLELVILQADLFDFHLDAELFLEFGRRFFQLRFGPPNFQRCVFLNRTARRSISRRRSLRAALGRLAEQPASSAPTIANAAADRLNVFIFTVNAILLPPCAVLCCAQFPLKTILTSVV